MRQFIFTFMLLAAFTNVSWANLYEGIIVETFDGGQSIKVSQVDRLTKEKQTIMVSIGAQTQISGVGPGVVLKQGDAVSINAVEVDSNRLFAKTISVISNK